MSEFGKTRAQDARKDLGVALNDSPSFVKMRAMPWKDGDASLWVSVPLGVFRHVLSAIRGEGEDKPFPHTFMGGRVIAASRIASSRGTAPHQGVIIREYEEQGVIRYSVHYIAAHQITDSWDGDTGDYDIKTLEEAFSEFMERMHRRGRLKRRH